MEDKELTKILREHAARLNPHTTSVANVNVLRDLWARAEQYGIYLAEQAMMIAIHELQNGEENGQS